MRSSKVRAVAGKVPAAQGNIDMLKKLGLAMSLLMVGAVSASAQFGPPPSRTLPPPGSRFDAGPPPATPAWRQGHHPYARQHHADCHRKAWRLHRFESYARSDGRLSKDERRLIEGLRYDLDRTCGRYRWRG